MSVTDRRKSPPQVEPTAAKLSFGNEVVHVPGSMNPDAAEQAAGLPPIDQVDTNQLSHEKGDSTTEDKIYGLPVSELEDLLKIQQEVQARAFKIVRHLRAAEDRIQQVKRDKKAVQLELEQARQLIKSLQIERDDWQAKAALGNQWKQELTSLHEDLARHQEANAQARSQWESQIGQLEVLNQGLETEAKKLRADLDVAQTESANREQQLLQQSQDLARSRELIEISRRKILEFQRSREETAELRARVSQQTSELEELRAIRDRLSGEIRVLQERNVAAREEREELLKLMRSAMERLERHRGDSNIPKSSGS